MIDFLLEISENAAPRFLHCEGERVFERDDKCTYIFGITDGSAFSDLRESLAGAFIAVEFEKREGVCRVIQSRLGGNKTVFYMEHGGKTYVFTSIKLLSKLGIACRFNDNHDIVCEFIYNGFIRTRDTLICGVYKLLADEYLRIEGGRLRVCSFERFTAAPKNIGTAEIYELECGIIGRYIALAERNDSALNIAVSGGYDSNLILHVLRQSGKKARAFSIGGSRGQDETAAAARICDAAEETSLETAYVTRNTLGELESIVRILEGSVYERGVFLQYELAKLLSQNGVSCVLLGECADQVFNRNFYDLKEPDYLTDYIKHPYELGTMVVLKKSVLMLDAFGISGIYPFTDGDMLRLGAEIYEENGTSKIRQRQMCDAFFDDKIRSLIEKLPGSSSLCALFADEEEEAAFVRRVQETNPFYDPGFRISYKYGPGESELDYYLCLEYLRVFREIFCDE